MGLQIPGERLNEPVFAQPVDAELFQYRPRAGSYQKLQRIGKRLARGLIELLQRLDHRRGGFEPALLEIGQGAGVGAGENVKERVDELRALRLGQLTQKGPQRLVHESAALGKLRQVLEALTQNLPRKAVVLHEPDLCAAHDLI